MARYHEPYTLYLRTIKPSGLKVYYYQTYAPDGRRLPGRSTGKATMREAVLYCEGLLEAGALIPGPRPEKPVAEVRRSRRPPTLREWASERHWWEWGKDGPECLYCKGELRRSDEGRPAIQQEYADRCARILRDYILPSLGDKRLDKITTADCEDLMDSWSDAGAGNKTVNNRASVARVMFGEAARLGTIPASPWAVVKGYTVTEYKRGILSLDEYRRLMSPVDLGARWRLAVYYDVNLLASVTGLRMSECVALKREDVHLDHVTVSVKYRIGYGEGPQKTKRGTDNLPIPRMVGSILMSLAEITPPGGYVFSLSGGKHPATPTKVAEALVDALAAIGIDDATRQARRVSFHSWRAFANTYFLDRGIARDKVQELTRHESDEMTDHYRAWSPDSFREIAAAQAELVEGLE